MDKIMSPENIINIFNVSTAVVTGILGAITGVIISQKKQDALSKRSKSEDILPIKVTKFHDPSNCPFTNDISEMKKNINNLNTTMAEVKVETSYIKININELKDSIKHITNYILSKTKNN